MKNYKANIEVTDSISNEFTDHVYKGSSFRLQNNEKKINQLLELKAKLEAYKKCSHENLEAYYGPVEGYKKNYTRVKCNDCGYIYWPTAPL